MPQQLLSVIGIGLIGGSVALAARRTGAWRVRGFDADPAARHTAARLNLVDDLASSAQDAAAGCDLLVLAVPVSHARAVLRAVAPRLTGGAFVTDTLSTKRSILAAARELLPQPARFVGAHPMAGDARGGPTAARADLFDAANCYVLDAGTETARAKVIAFWQSLGCRTQTVSADDHDETVAAASHLPQLVASALAATLTPAELAAGGNGLRDTTRIAASPAALWRDILLDNRDAVLAALTRFEQQAAAFRAALEAGDAEQLASLLRDASKKRNTLDAPP